MQDHPNIMHDSSLFCVATTGFFSLMVVGASKSMAKRIAYSSSEHQPITPICTTHQSSMSMVTLLIKISELVYSFRIVSGVYMHVLGVHYSGAINSRDSMKEEISNQNFDTYMWQ